MISRKISETLVQEYLSTSWGPPRVKVGGGGKGSWTGRQIGMLMSYFVLIKLSVIKCLFNYDNALLLENGEKVTIFSN